MVATPMVAISQEAVRAKPSLVVLAIGFRLGFSHLHIFLGGRFGNISATEDIIDRILAFTT